MSEHVGHRGFGILHYPQDRAALFMGGACVAEGSTLAVCAAARLFRQVQDTPPATHDAVSAQAPLTPRDRLLSEYQARHGYPHPRPDEIPDGWGEPLTPEESADFSARHVAEMEANRAARIASAKMEIDELEGKSWS